MKVRVEIDQLVLYGFKNNKYDADHIDQDIENELARLIAKYGIKNNRVIKSGDGDIINRIDGESFNFESGHSISELAGASIAKSIYSIMGCTQ